MTMTTKSSPPPGQYLTLGLRAKPQEAQSENGELLLQGIANDANVTDSFGTRIRLSQRALDGFMTNAVCLYSHDVSEPIGTIRSIAYNGGKLEVEAAILPGTRTPSGTDIQNLIRAGALNAFSIRFDEYKTRQVGDYTQIDAEVLDEISVVSLPSNRASLFQMRSKGIELHGAEELMPEQIRTADARKAEATRAAGPLDFSLLMQRLSVLICDEKSDGDYWSSAYLVAVYDDVCVWSEYGEATYYQQGYAVDAAGTVTLTGAEQEVIPQWKVVGGADDEGGERAISEADMGAVVSEVLLRVRTQLGLDFTGEPILHQRAILRALNTAGVPTPPASEPEAPAPEAAAELSLDEVRSAIRQAAQSVTGAQPG
ncbi:HK97 family phage prohead protease [Deinococcus sp.]|uniref:HK97 family phage prohead protease n=1 Tax=Deinococcus sp. TaxID=47478 RepID=UPI00286E5E88|nr:HK97 family phage prohead protease [Deinococcus sp.]